jgi:hypothetical protein
MSNYVKATNFFAKDALLTTDPNKIIKGAEIDDEYNALSVAIATKANTDSPGLTGTPTAPTATPGTSSTQIASTAFTTAAIAAIPAPDLSTVHPIGSIYMATVSTNPATLLGFGTWVAFGEGRVLLGADGSYPAGSTGGAATHTLTVDELPSHSHTTPIRDTSQGVGGGSGTGTPGSLTTRTSSAVGGGTAHNNLQPYISVYMWNRTA